MAKTINKSITCPKSSSRYHAARNGNSDWAGFDAKESATIYFGAPVDVDGYSSYSAISSIKLTYDFRSTTTSTNGSSFTPNGKTYGRALLGDDGMFTCTGDNIDSYNGALAESTDSSTYSGYYNSTGWVSEREGHYITSGTISGSYQANSYTWLGAAIHLQNTSTVRTLHLYLSDVKLNYTINVRNIAEFYDGNTRIAYEIHDYGTPMITVTPTAPTGKKLKGWRKGSPTGTLIQKSSNELDPYDGYDVKYYAEWEPIDYTVEVKTVDQDGATIAAPTGQTGNQAYQIGGSAIVVTAPTTDYNINSDGSVIYVFDYWSMTDSSGNAIGSNVYTNTRTYGQLTASNIPTLFASGTTITATAHYRRVYDVTVSLSGVSAQDPSGVGQNGVSRIDVLDSNDTTLATVSGDALRDANQVVRITESCVKFSVVLTDNSQYQLFATTSISNISFNQNTWLYDVTSSTASVGFIIYKRYFSLSISGDTDNIIKIYRVNDNGTKSVISASNIPRTTRLSIEADPALEIQKTHDADVTAISPSVSGTTTVSEGVGIITPLLQDHTITVTRTQVNYTVTQTVNSDGYSPSTISGSVVRSNAQRFYVAPEGGWTIASATLTMGGTQQQSWTNVDTIDYTISGVTGDCVFVANRVQNPQAYVTISTPNSAYGNVTFLGSTSVLKSSFNGFTVSAITALSEYEAVGAIYRWLVNNSEVSRGTLTLGTENTIMYSGTIPTSADVECVVEVTYRKNIVYHSSRQNNTTTVKRPSALYYTPVGGTPQPVIAVYAQTSTHTTPILLFGDV